MNNLGKLRKCKQFGLLVMKNLAISCYRCFVDSLFVGRLMKHCIFHPLVYDYVM